MATLDHPLESFPLGVVENVEEEEEGNLLKEEDGEAVVAVGVLVVVTGSIVMAILVGRKDVVK